MTEMKSRADRRNLTLVFLVTSLIMAASAMLLHLAHTPDELGVMANSAYLAGYDWSYGIHLAGDYYYKYGIALFHTLPYLLMRDSVWLYRTLLLINGLALGVTGIACYLVCRRHLKVESPNEALLITLACTAVPAALLHSSYTRADFALVLTSWLVLLFFLEAYRSNGRRKTVFSALCAVTAVYAFMSHTRGIVLIIALFLTILAVRLMFGIRTVRMGAYLCATAASLILDRFLTAFFKLALWPYGAGHASVEGARFSEMRTLLTPAGLKIFIKSIIGWFYTAFSTTMGLVCVGVIAALLLLFFAFRKIKNVSEELIITGTLGLLNLGGSMALGLLFFYPYLYDSFHEMKGRFDRVFYERYMIGALGILCLVALYVLMVRRDLFGKWAKAFSAAVFAGVVGAVWKWIAVLIPKRVILPRYTMTLHVLSRFITDRKQCILAAGVLALCVFLFLLLFLGRRQTKWLATAVLLVVYLCTYTICYHDIRLSEDRDFFSPLQRVYSQVEALGVDTEQFPYLCFRCKSRTIKTKQPLFKEFQMLTQKTYSEDITDLLIITPKKEDAEELLKNGPAYKLGGMDYESQTGNLLYVKGEKLKDHLTEKGVTLIECGRDE